MFRVVGKSTIQISRGDYALIPLKVIGAEQGEEIVFSVSKKEDPVTALIEKRSAVIDNMAYFAFSQEETKMLDSGNYIWDVYLPHFWDINERHTPQTPKIFQILGVSHVV